MTWRRVALVACVLGGACFSDFIIAPEPNLDPHLSALVTVSDVGAPRYGVFVVLDPGTTVNGDDRSLGDTTMMVGDSVVFGTRIDLRREVVWQWTDSKSTVARDSLVVALPGVLGFPMTDRTIRLPVAARVGPRELTLSPGEALPLRIRGVSDPLPGLESTNRSVRWIFEIADTTRAKHLTLGGVGPRTDFTVPASLLPTAIGDSLIARVTVLQSLRVANAPFPVGVFIQSSFDWAIRVVAP